MGGGERREPLLNLFLDIGKSHQQKCDVYRMHCMKCRKCRWLSFYNFKINIETCLTTGNRHVHHSPSADICTVLVYLRKCDLPLNETSHRPAEGSGDDQTGLNHNDCCRFWAKSGRDMDMKLLYSSVAMANFELQARATPTTVGMFKL